MPVILKGRYPKKKLSASTHRPLLIGKRALITGATSGLGKQIALYFAEQGADVAMIGRNPERARKTFLEVEKARFCTKTQKVWIETLDVASKEAVDQGVLRLMQAWGGVEILVNNAGVTRDQLLMKMTEDDWDCVIATNLKSVYNFCHALARPMLKARYGKIINLASVVGLTGNPGQVNYAASKAGIIGLTRALAKEFAARGICVNCIAPGFFETPMTAALSASQKEQLLGRIPMKRFGHPKEVAHAAFFLASYLSDYMTGQVLTIDGGMLA